MEDLETILAKANELGHLLAANEIVRRYQDLGRRLDESAASRQLLEDYIEAAQAVEHLEGAGEGVPDAERTRIRELEEKARGDSLIREFLATQTYYLHLMARVNQAIAQPTGEPPRKSNIIVPGEGRSGPGIVIP